MGHGRVGHARWWGACTPGGWLLGVLLPLLLPWHGWRSRWWLSLLLLLLLPGCCTWGRTGTSRLLLLPWRGAWRRCIARCCSTRWQHVLPRWWCILPMCRRYTRWGHAWCSWRGCRMWGRGARPCCCRKRLIQCCCRVRGAHHGGIQVRRNRCIVHSALRPEPQDLGKLAAQLLGAAAPVECGGQHRAQHRQEGRGNGVAGVGRTCWPLGQPLEQHVIGEIDNMELALIVGYPHHSPRHHAR
mmetsp:Transcript_29074/g.64206  ORF Transcript_29074/g.64206 Transcript_29074/m.64206 type:complete len:242 (-) Transcript_29074:604-1329(-)